jgi:hypothetical protein
MTKGDHSQNSGKALFNQITKGDIFILKTQISKEPHV